MAIKQRSVLSTQNTTLSTNKDTAFPDNNNKEITAADLRTWLDELLSQVQDILDSYFNKLDELRITSTLNYDIVATPTDWNGGTAPATQNLVNDELASRVETIENEPNQTAFETPYTPTTPAEWNPEGAPTEVKGGLDILAGRTGVNLSQDIAYVTSSGNNTGITPELGNPLKPYDNFGDAINAVPVGGTVKALGGTYTGSIETFGYIFVNKNGITLDISGTTINGRIFFRGSDINLIAIGSLITDTGTASIMGIGSGSSISNLKIIGGTFVSTNGSCFDFSPTLTSITIKDAIFDGNRNLSSIGSFGQSLANVANCSFTNQLGITVRCIGAKSTFINCKFSSQNESALQLLSSAPAEVSVKQCELRGRIGFAGTNTTGFYFNAIVEDSYLEGSDYGAFYGAIADNVRFTNTIISGGIDAVRFATIERTTANNNNIFERSSLYAGTGDIFFGSFAAADLGNAIVTNCIYNKAFAGIAGKVVENNITTIVGIQNVGF
jgi:hypothetical protein